jgi:hypothetical protein
MLAVTFGNVLRLATEFGGYGGPRARRSDQRLATQLNVGATYEVPRDVDCAFASESLRGLTAI